MLTILSIYEQDKAFENYHNFINNIICHNSREIFLGGSVSVIN